MLEEMPDLKDQGVQDATVKIQAAYRGFQTRKKVKLNTYSFDVVMAVVKIQSAFRAYKARQKVKMLKDMPDLKSKEVKMATVKIQAAYRGFQTRKVIRKHSAFDVVRAVMVIQSAYRGYKARQKIKMLKDMPDLRCAEVKQATVKIQAAYRGFQTRKKGQTIQCNGSGYCCHQDTVGVQGLQGTQKGGNAQGHARLEIKGG